VKKASKCNLLGMGIRIESDKPYMIVPRSSMGLKTQLRMSNSIGIIDKGYRGEIGLIVDNLSIDDYDMNAGERLVQIIAPSMEPIHIEVVDELDMNTSRGEGGFGSTGE
jgi:dUTP pyrophosphatase